MSLFDTFATDPKAEAEGRWFKYPANRDKTIPRFKLARMSRTNPRFQARLEAVAKQFKTEIKLDLLTEEATFEPMLEAFCDTVLLGWENVYDREDKPITYSRDEAVKLMKALPALYDDLREKANA